MDKRLSVADMTYIAVCAVLMAVCSWITIPAAVPFTMQTFGVFLIVQLLGGKKGALSVLVFILLGAAGLPVFSGFSGGIGRILGLTGGYIVGFVVLALIYEAAMRAAGRVLKGARETDRAYTAWKCIALIAGCAACYAFGTAWFMAVYQRQSGPITLGAVLGMCVIPFIIPDLIKLILSMVLAKRLKRVLPDLPD